MKKICLFMVLATLAACATKKEDEHAQHAGKKQAKNVEKAVAQISTPDKKVSGEVNFNETSEGIKVMIHLTGLRPKSVHGIHIHENGKCEGPSFKSAGGHFNPAGHDHAHPGAEQQHAGDFGNVVSDKMGNAKKELLIKKSQIEDLDIVIGKAVILHTEADDLISQPTGEAGGRMACALIKESK